MYEMCTSLALVLWSTWIQIQRVVKQVEKGKKKMKASKYDGFSGPWVWVKLLHTLHLHHDGSSAPRTFVLFIIIKGGWGELYKMNIRTVIVILSGMFGFRYRSLSYFTLLALVSIIGLATLNLYHMESVRNTWTPISANCKYNFLFFLFWSCQTNVPLFSIQSSVFSRKSKSREYSMLSFICDHVLFSFYTF